MAGIDTAMAGYGRYRCSYGPKTKIADVGARAIKCPHIDKNNQVNCKLPHFFHNFMLHDFLWYFQSKFHQNYGRRRPRCRPSQTKVVIHLPNAVIIAIRSLFRNAVQVFVDGG